jgi:hypothetical protein
MVQDMMTVHEETLKDGSKVWKRVWEENEGAFLKAVDNMNRAKADLDLANFNDALAALKEQGSYIGMSDAEKQRSQYQNSISQYSPFQQSQLMGEYDNNALQKTMAFSEKYKTNLQHQLELLKMSREERERQLLIDQGIHETAVEEILAIQKQLDLEQMLADLKDSIKNMMLDTSTSGMVDMFASLGQALREGADAGEAMGSAFRNMVRNMLSQLSSLLMLAGVRIIAEQGTAGLPLGLALMAAGGASAFLGGLIDESKATDRAKQQLDELKRLQDQFIKLIEDQRTMEDYYFQKRRELNAFGTMTTTTVNDAIITPKGIVNTHPDDFIIATKRPDRLMGGGGNVQIIINDNADNSTVTQTEKQSGDMKQVIVSIDNLVKRNLANGNYTDALTQAIAKSQGVRRNG